MATNFLWFPGTGNSGLLTTAITLASTELVSLGSSAVVTIGTVYGTSVTGQGIWGEVYVTFGTSVAAPAPGANLAGWWLTSPDGGTTFESTAGFNPGPARAPDFIIPVSTIAIAAGVVAKAAGLVRIPALDFKVSVQNNLGVTFSSSATANPSLLLAPVAVQY